MASRRDAQRLRHRAFAQTQAFTQTRAERPRLSLRLHPTQAERPFLARWAEADASRAERAAGTALIQQRMCLLWVEQACYSRAIALTLTLTLTRALTLIPTLGARSSCPTLRCRAHSRVRSGSGSSTASMPSRTRQARRAS